MDLVTVFNSNLNGLYLTRMCTEPTFVPQFLMQSYFYQQKKKKNYAIVKYSLLSSIEMLSFLLTISCVNMYGTLIWDCRFCNRNRCSTSAWICCLQGWETH